MVVVKDTCMDKEKYLFCAANFLLGLLTGNKYHNWQRKMSNSNLHCNVSDNAFVHLWGYEVIKGLTPNRYKGVGFHFKQNCSIVFDCKEVCVWIQTQLNFSFL